MWRRKGARSSTATRGAWPWSCRTTSPRGDDAADDEAWDLGKGAGFYVDATAAPWSRHYKMYSYVTKELPKVLLACDFADDWITSECRSRGTRWGDTGR